MAKWTADDRDKAGKCHSSNISFDGDIMKLNLNRPTEEDLTTTGVVWITPAIEINSPHPLRRIRVLWPSYKLQGVGQEVIPEAEIPTNPQVNHTETYNSVKVKEVRDWKDFTGFPSDKVQHKTLEATAQLYTEPVEEEQREIPRQHREKRLLLPHPRRL